MKEGFAGIQTARTLIRDPWFVKTIERELEKNEKRTEIESKKGNVGAGEGGESAGPRDVVSSCTHCNMCVIASLSEGHSMRCIERTKEEDDAVEFRGDSASTLVDIEDLMWKNQI